MQNMLLKFSNEPFQLSDGVIANLQIRVGGSKKLKTPETLIMMVISMGQLKDMR